MKIIFIATVLIGLLYISAGVTESNKNSLVSDAAQSSLDDAANVRVLRDAGRKTESGNKKKNKKNKNKSVKGKNKKNNKSAKRNKKNKKKSVKGKSKKNNKSAKRNKKNKSKSAKRNNKKNNKSAKRNNKKNNKSAKRNNKKNNKSAKRNKKNKTKSAKRNKKMAKNNSRWTADCATDPFSLLAEVTKKYQTAQSQLKKALRINKFYDTAEKKKDKARTTFNEVTSAMSLLTGNGSICGNASIQAAALENYDTLKDCSVTAATICDATADYSAEDQEIIGKDATKNPTVAATGCILELNTFIAGYEACLRPVPPGAPIMCACFEDLTSPPTRDCMSTSKFTSIDDAVKEVKKKCTDPNTPGSFGNCRSAQKEAAPIGQECGCYTYADQSCSVTTTMTTAAPTSCPTCPSCPTTTTATTSAPTNATAVTTNLNRLFIAYAHTGKHIVVNLDTGDTCDAVPDLITTQTPTPSTIINLAAVNYLDGHGIVACGGLLYNESNRCHLFNGTQWNPLPDSKYTHCYHNTKDSIVQQGSWFVTGQDQIEDGNKTNRTGNNNGCSDTTDIRVSEVLTYNSSTNNFTWVEGPNLTLANGDDVEVRACLAQLDENTSVFTGGFALNCTDPTVPACQPGRPGDRHHLPNIPLKETWLYDWANQNLTEVKDFTVPRYVHGCALLNDSTYGILIAGGYTNDFTETRTVELYDLDENSWTTQEPLPNNETIKNPFPTLLTRGYNSVIALFVKESKIFSRQNDGTWTPLANVNLTTPFGNGISRFDQDRVVLIPDDFIIKDCP